MTTTTAAAYASAMEAKATTNPVAMAAMATHAAPVEAAIAAADARIGRSMTADEAAVSIVAAVAAMETADSFYAADAVFQIGVSAGVRAVHAVRRSTEDVFIYDVCQCRQYGLTKDLKFVIRRDDESTPWEDNGYYPVPGCRDRDLVMRKVRYLRRVAAVYFSTK